MYQKVTLRKHHEIRRVMSKLNEIRNLEQIRHALSFLDLKGTDEKVTMAMTIVAVAEDFVRRGQPLEAARLLQYAQRVPLNVSM